MNRIGFLAAVCLAWLASDAGGQDFSEGRLRQGRESYRAHRTAEAIDSLRVAAFGLLDRPAQLCEALVFLALSQESAARHADAQTALERLSEAERRMPACSDADIDPATRLDFETRFHRRLLAGMAATGTPAAAAKGATAGEEGGTLPRVRKSFPPVYPRAARDARVGGTVVLRVLVSESGRPLQVEVVRGVRPDLADAAVASIQKWTFEPARRNGRDVRSWTTVDVPFLP